MKIAVIGSGGREHALVKALAKSPKCTELVAIPGNGGIAQDAACVDLQATDVAGVVAWCTNNGVDYVVVAPDNPLALGMVDKLADAGIPAFGPSAAAAQIEASKVFAKDLMQRYEIPTAAYCVADTLAETLGFIRAREHFPLVVKADGLALGKGVVICKNRAEAEDAVTLMMGERIFGDSGARVVLEEFLTGPEVSLLAFTDGERLVPMVSSMDFKRAQDGDLGPNTGGMGAIAPNPLYTPAVAKRCMREIFMPTIAAMRAEGRPFKGCLYFGLMLTADGPKVIEYNCRFGDPETQVVLPLLKGDLLEILLACTEGRLADEMVHFKKAAAACVVLASGGYPGDYEKGLPIAGLAEAAAVPGVTVYHAGTKRAGESLVTAGGRVLGVTAVADTLPGAIDRAYEAADCIHFEGATCRRDIGRRAMELEG